jgi:hypothetical protein
VYRLLAKRGDRDGCFAKIPLLTRISKPDRPFTPRVAIHIEEAMPGESLVKMLSHRATKFKLSLGQPDLYLIVSLHPS